MMLERAILEAKRDRLCFEIIENDEGSCKLRRLPMGGYVQLHLTFDALERQPQPQDKLYFSQNLHQGLAEGLHMYQFSAQIGNSCAREPHDFLQNPREFLILEYADGEKILLEQQYG